MSGPFFMMRNTHTPTGSAEVVNDFETPVERI
jgi:hypothetical protein